MAFTTIHPTPGLTPAERRRAHRSGPRAVATRTDHVSLLRSAGFVDVEQVDITPAFERTARAWIEECTEHADELAAIEGADLFADRQVERGVQLRAIEDGLLQRAMLSARRPG
jgi:hypothetical protein